MAGGSNGRRSIGNFSSTMFGHGSSSLTDVSFWNSTGARTALRSLPRNGVIFLRRKARAFFAGRRCLELIQISVRDLRWCSRRPVGDAPQRVVQLRATFRTAKRLQFPVCAIPAENLLDLRDVFRKQVVEENPLLPVHRAFVRHDISIFAAHRTQWFALKERKDGSEGLELVRLELFELHDLHLLARKEFEQTGKLPSIKAAIDISKSPRVSRRCATNARLFFSHGVKKIQRLSAFESLHVPMRKGAFDRISQNDQQFNLRIVFRDPFSCWLVIQVTGRAITSDR